MLFCDVMFILCPFTNLAVVTNSATSSLSPFLFSFCSHAVLLMVPHPLGFFNTVLGVFIQFLDLSPSKPYYVRQGCGNFIVNTHVSFDKKKRCAKIVQSTVLCVLMVVG